MTQATRWRRDCAQHRGSTAWSGGYTAVVRWPALLTTLLLATGACGGPTVPFGSLEGEPSGDSTTTEGGEGSTPECPQPLPPDWIFCEDFDAATDPASRFFEFDIDPAMEVVDTVGASGTSSLQVTHVLGEVGQSSVSVAFGRNPAVTDPDPPQPWPNEDFDEVFARVRLKMDEDWPDTGPGAFLVMAAYGSSDRGEASRLLLEALAPQFVATPSTCVAPDGTLACSRDNDPAQTPLTALEGRTPLFSTAYADAWHCVEVHMKLNAPGGADGLVEVWVDDVLEVSQAGLDWRGPWQDYGINLFQIPSGGRRGDSPTVFRRWVDDVAIARSRIGCESPPR